MPWLGNQCQLSTHTFPYVFPVCSCSSETDCKSHWLWWPAFPVCLKYFYKHRCFGLMRASISWYLHKVEPFPHCTTGLIFEDTMLSRLCYVEPDVWGTWEKGEEIVLVIITLLQLSQLHRERKCSWSISAFSHCDYTWKNGNYFACFCSVSCSLLASFPVPFHVKSTTSIKW